MRASITSITENGNKTLVSTKTRGATLPPSASPLAVRTESTGRFGVAQHIGDLTPPLPAALTPLLERQHIGKTHHTVTTSGQIHRRDVAGIKQTGDERSRQAQKLSSLSRRQLNLGGQDSDRMPAGQLAGGGEEDTDSQPEVGGPGVGGVAQRPQLRVACVHHPVDLVADRLDITGSQWSVPAVAPPAASTRASRALRRRTPAATSTASV